MERAEYATILPYYTYLPQASKKERAEYATIEAEVEALELAAVAAEVPAILSMALLTMALPTKALLNEPSLCQGINMHMYMCMYM